MTKEKSWNHPMKGESAKSFARFEDFSSLSPEKRTIHNAFEKIKCRELSDNATSEDEKKLLRAVEKNCERWFWVERSNLKDFADRIKKAEKDEKNFEKLSKKTINYFKKVLNWADKTFRKIIHSDYALSTQVKLVADVTYVVAKCHEQIRLAYGKSTTNNFNDNKNSGEIDINIKPGEENIYEYTPEEMERIQNISNEQEDFTDKL